MAKKDRFDYFSAFEGLSEVAVKQADLLIDLLDNFEKQESLLPYLEKAHKLEHEGDAFNHKFYKAVATDFITPIEREDIVELAQALDDIIDDTEDIMQRFYVYDIHEMHEDVYAFAEIIKKSCEAINAAMGDFRNFKKSKKFKQFIVDINTYEEEGDSLYMTVTRKLFTEKRDDTTYVYVWSLLFDRMEKCTDACEHASYVMQTITLKNS